MSTVSGYRFSNDEVQIHVQCSLDLEWTPQLTATCEGASSDNIRQSVTSAVYSTLRPSYTILVHLCVSWVIAETSLVVIELC